MRIRKKYQVIPTNAKLENGDSTSATNGYTAEYINDHSVVVSPTEPTESARKKVWKQTLEQDISGLYNKNTRNVSYYVSSENGELVSNNVNDTTDYINVGSYKTITITNGVNDDTYAFYDKNKTFIRGGNYTNGIAINVINAVYIRITVKKTVVDTISISAIKNISKEYILNDNDVYEEFEPQNEIYSTNEVRIGTWIDGKPLYRKCFSISITNKTNVTIGTLQNIDFISITDKSTTYFIGGANTYYVPVSTYEASTNFSKFYVSKNNSNNTASIIWMGNETTGTLIAVVEYTKTTD